MESKKIGRESEGDEEEVIFDLGIGTILEFVQSEGKVPVEREELKIRERGSEIL